MQRKTMFESAVGEGWRVSSVLITAKEVHAIFLNTMYCFQYCTLYVFIPYISPSNVCSNVFVTLEGSCVFFNSPEKNARDVLTVTRY